MRNGAYFPADPVFRKPHRRGFAAFALLQVLFLWGFSGSVQADAPTDADPEVKTGPRVFGFIQFQVFNQPIDTNNDGEVNEGRFRIQRARLSVDGRINRYITYEMDIDPRTPELDGLLRDAFFDIEYRPNHMLRLGQQKTKFGYENQQSSSRLYMVNRTELSDGMARGVNLRDLGVTLLGKWRLGEDSRFEYAVSVVNGAGATIKVR